MTRRSGIKLDHDGKVDAVSIGKSRLEYLLVAGTDEIFLVEAAVRLVVKTDYWLNRNDFLRYVEIYGNPPEAAGIWFQPALMALDNGELRADEESSSILRIAGSLVVPYELILREVVESIGEANIKHVAEAIMYAASFTEGVAYPKRQPRS